ncbi:stage III sporulation protein AC [Anaerovoracaceae bacterium 41-7]|uniref:Stage III sporulation protein AC n=1 Tax=Anaerotruncus colihominis TaxID=169435 RepID=A0A845QM43_9FIRM|nr:MULTISPECIES: stage III sporulation protein AC [Clostridia]MCI9475488.1 stage III sporulation protein AC [Emergencia sp.]MCI9639602.1 stage III sporulation protein AC [Emergencia sp.]NBH61138.1 stage III sporulation protein AC [Anaerotruncus colihominis]NCE98948.1 stage III sporulation protein AC [Emergencia sp. 1XD21-10]NCF01793.1 stage III sporulation protein AC [Anaerotruncus sp. 80]
MEISIIFKIAGIGICIALVNQILVKAGKDEMAMMTTLAGVIIVLVIIVKMLAEFFETMKVFMEF